MAAEIDMTKKEFCYLVLRVSAKKSKQTYKTPLIKRLMHRSISKSILSFAASPEAKFKEDVTSFSPFPRVLSPTEKNAVSLALS